MLLFYLSSKLNKTGLKITPQQKKNYHVGYYFVQYNDIFRLILTDWYDILFNEEKRVPDLICFFFEAHHFHQVSADTRFLISFEAADRTHMLHQSIKPK